MVSTGQLSYFDAHTRFNSSSFHRKNTADSMNNLRSPGSQTPTVFGQIRNTFLGPWKEGIDSIGRYMGFQYAIDTIKKKVEILLAMLIIV